MGVKSRLSLMMFLQYAIWGAWLPILWPFLAGHRGLNPEQIGNMFAVGAIGALLAPFIAGQIADRWFSTQHFLALSHLIGAGLVYKLATVESYSGFLVYSLLYSIVYAPTLPLTNSITFHHIKDRDKEFGRIRMWGTVGWIVVGLAVGQWLSLQWTPTKEEATAQVIEARVLDTDGRTRLLEDSRVTLENKDVYEGIVVVDSDGDLVITLPSDSGSWEDGETKTEEFGADEVTTILPMLEVVTEIEDRPGRWPWSERGPQSPGDVAKSEARATLLETTLRALESDSGDAAKDAARRSLEDAMPFNAGTLQAPISRSHDEGRADAFKLSALLGLLLAVFCLMLPNTPPQRSKQTFAAGAAFQRVQVNPLLTLFLLAIPVSCIHQFYFVHTSTFLSGSGIELGSTISAIFGVGGGGLMTIGQVSELAVLALIPMFSKKASRKFFLGIGLAAYGLRMLLFAYPESIPLPEALTLMTGVALHGLCFGCFIFVSFMIVDEETSGDVRASAQSLYNLVIVGVGVIVGSKIAGGVSAWATTGETVNYTKLFSVPMWASFACLAILLLFYPSKKPRASDAVESY